MSKTNEEIVEDVVVICDGLYTGKTGKVLGVGSSPHSIKLLVDSNERYEPDYALLTITKENKRAVELLLSHYTTLKAKNKECEERVREEREAIVREVGLLLEAENDCQHTPSDSCDTTCMHQESTRVWNSAIREVRKVIEERQQALT